MVAKYIMQEVKDLNNEGDTLLYPRMVIRDSCGTDELAEVSLSFWGTGWPGLWLRDVRCG